MFRVVIVLCFLSVAASQLPAQAYRWVDDEGVVHYSDTPHPGAEQIELETAPAIDTPRPRSVSPRVTGAASNDDEENPSVYESLTVASPAAEETLWNIGGQLDVSLSLQPSLRPGHQVRVYFDGEPQSVNGTQFRLAEVYRGAHNLQAEVLDQNGNLLIRSQPQRFYVQATSVINPR